MSKYVVVPSLDDRIFLNLEFDNISTSVDRFTFQLDTIRYLYVSQIVIITQADRRYNMVIL